MTNAKLQMTNKMNCKLSQAKACGYRVAATFKLRKKEIPIQLNYKLGITNLLDLSFGIEKRISKRKLL